MFKFRKCKELATGVTSVVVNETAQTSSAGAENDAIGVHVVKERTVWTPTAACTNILTAQTLQVRLYRTCSGKTCLKQPASRHEISQTKSDQVKALPSIQF